MAVESVFTFLAVLIWMGIGAVITLLVWWRVEWNFDRKGGSEAVYAEFAERLGKPCWKDGGKYRVVAVSHKGAICIRPWDEERGSGGRWVPSGKVSERVSFTEPVGD